MSFIGDIFDAVTGAKHAATQDKIAGNSEKRAGKLFGEQQGFEQQLEALMKDPGSVKDLPGYKFQFDQGTQAVARQMAASGFGGSGNEAIALTQYGQGFAENAYQQQAQLLAQLSGLTQNSNDFSRTAASANSSANDMWSSVFNGIGQMFSGSKLGSSGSSGGLPGFGSLFGT